MDKMLNKLNCWILIALKTLSGFPAVIGSMLPTAFIPHQCSPREHDENFRTFTDSIMSHYCINKYFHRDRKRNKYSHNESNTLFPVTLNSHSYLNIGGLTKRPPPTILSIQAFYSHSQGHKQLQTARMQAHNLYSSISLFCEMLVLPLISHTHISSVENAGYVLVCMNCYNSTAIQSSSLA